MISRRYMLLPLMVTGCLSGESQAPNAVDPQAFQPVLLQNVVNEFSTSPRATISTPGGEIPTPLGGGSENPGNTFEHPDLVDDPFGVLDEVRTIGAPEITSRLHDCQKPKYATLRTILTNLGVDVNNQAPLSAGRLFREGSQALGAPNYRARTSESAKWTTSGATKALDIFVQAAPEVIAAMPNNPHCAVGGRPTNMFDETGRFTVAGITCLQGARPTQAQKDISDAIALEGETGRVIAVAAILAAAHTCE